MPMMMCSAGKHFYNPDLYDACPSCEEDGVVQDAPTSESPTSATPTHVLQSGGQGAQTLAESLPKTTATGAVSTPKTAVPRESIKPQDQASDELKAPIAPIPPAPASATDNGLKTRVVFGTENATSSSESLPVVGWLVVVEGPGCGADFRLIQGENKIGRGDDMEVCLNFAEHSDDTVSREAHAVVVYDNYANEFFIERGNSRNLPQLNGVTIRRDQTLKANDIIQLGATKLRFVPFCGDQFTW
ncbi:FHA domain-containing protein [Aliidiomarina celeris]|uniref:FHA domain-containing protein n=1 Tax=Aliidiomarina celeris TaxID=2249428 RepID=UPI000DE9828D|nr:FHA domain-containing protein [Aliidiomarina celeris]